MMAGSALPWTVNLSGDPVLESDLARCALERGGHLRVGIEDAAGMTPLSTAEMAHDAVFLADAVGRTAVSGVDAFRALAGQSAPGQPNAEPPDPGNDRIDRSVRSTNTGRDLAAR